jgi:vacuolar-type H+-ATPase subunit H
MARQPDDHHSDPVVAAIERVLKSEREGVEALKRSKDEAGRLLTQARTEAAALTDRAERCISRLHTDYLKKIEREIERLAAAETDNDAAADTGFDDATRAARRVAAKLTGEA